MNESQAQLYERLMAAGVTSGEAGEICKAFVGTSNTPDSEPVDVDRLTKAMEGIRDAFDGDGEPVDASNNVDAAIQEASDIVDAVTKGADALLAEQRTQYEALSKALIALTTEVTELRTKVRDNGDTVSKSLASAQEQLNEPVMRKSIGNLETIALPGETTGFSPRALVSVALDEIRGESSNDIRKAELRKAISLLESGASAEQVATSYSLAASA